MGIGVLIDSIFIIKKLVFDEKCASIQQLKMQAEKDFEDASLYNKILNLKEHYGTNSDESNHIAKDISEFIGKVITKHPIDNNVVSLPGLFAFTQDIWHRNYNGTINGRKKGELLSYGIMPCATPHNDSLTEILLSCANISTQYFPDGCPVMISLNKKDIENNNALLSLIKTFFEVGGFHIAINTVDAKTWGLTIQVLYVLIVEKKYTVKSILTRYASLQIPLNILAKSTLSLIIHLVKANMKY